MQARYWFIKTITCHGCGGPYQSAHQVKARPFLFSPWAGGLGTGPATSKAATGYRWAFLCPTCFKWSWGRTRGWDMKAFNDYALDLAAPSQQLPAQVIDTRQYQLFLRRQANRLGPRLADWLAWGGGTVPALARAIATERTFDQLPVLADALEEAGCEHGWLLGYLRIMGPHLRGCWPLDLLVVPNKVTVHHVKGLAHFST